MIGEEWKYYLDRVTLSWYEMDLKHSESTVATAITGNEAEVWFGIRLCLHFQIKNFKEK